MWCDGTSGLFDPSIREYFRIVEDMSLSCGLYSSLSDLGFHSRQTHPKLSSSYQLIPFHHNLIISAFRQYDAESAEEEYHKYIEKLPRSKHKAVKQKDAWIVNRTTKSSGKRKRGKEDKGSKHTEKRQ
jgi:hypothetical protein